VPISVEGRLWGAIFVGSTREPLPADAEVRLAGFTELAATVIANAQACVEPLERSPVMLADPDRRMACLPTAEIQKGWKGLQHDCPRAGHAGTNPPGGSAGTAGCSPSPAWAIAFSQARRPSDGQQPQSSRPWQLAGIGLFG